MALSLLIISEGCATFQPRPYIIDVKNGVCEPFVVIKDNPLTYARSHKPEPIMNCNGFTGFSPEDAAEGLRKYREYQASHSIQSDQ